MLKFLFFFFLFSINQVKNEKRCDDHMHTFNEENLNKVARHDSINNCNRHNSHEGVLVLNITHNPVKERPVEEDNTIKLAHPVHARANKQNSPVALPIHKPIDPSQKQTTIKLTKGGTIYFMKNIQDSIKKHPVLSKNAKVITEIVNEAIENATIALQEAAEQQKKETTINSKKSQPTKPTEKCKIDSNEPKQKLPVIHHVIEIPHNLNESKVIVCDGDGKKIKLNSSVIIKHEDGDIHVLNHVNPPIIRTCVTDSHTKSKGLKEQIIPRYDITEQECSKNPIKNNTLPTNKANNEDVTKMREKLLSLLKPKVTNAPTPAIVPTVIENQIKLQLDDDDETDLNKESPTVLDLEDKIYEETYSKKSDTPSYSCNNEYPQGWYNNIAPYGRPAYNYPYYQAYGQNGHTNNIATGSYYPSPNPCAYTVEQYNDSNNVPTYAQSSYAYKNYEGRNNLLRRLWWDRKIRFYNANRDTQYNANVNNKYQYDHLIKANINPYYYHTKGKCFSY